MDVVVVAHPENPNLGRVVQAVELVNAVQAYFRLRLAPSKTLIRRKVQAPGPARRLLQAAYPNELVIGITEHDFPERMTIDEAPGCTLISSEDWIITEAPPAMRVYLVYQLVSALVAFAGCLSSVENEQMMHGRTDDENRGCLFDFWEDSDLLELGMVCARLCPACRAGLLKHGAPPEAVAATERLLEWVRSVVLGRERPLPVSVFIGHGHKDDWKIIKGMLEHWNVEVEEFNEEPVAGESVTQRLKTMLERSRFAFLVMTAEDEVGQKTANGKRLQARMNVVHEIGLFQGRLGSEYAIVLRERQAQVFSNLDGINRIDYDTGKIAALEQEIRALLVKRGVIHADAGLRSKSSNGHKASLRRSTARA